MGTVAITGQRAARFFRLGGGGSARFTQPSRHQKSRSRRPDKPYHLRKGPRRTSRELQGAGSGTALELLCCPAIRRRISARRALGSFQPSRAIAQIRNFRIPKPVVVGRREGSQDGWTL